jgi:hypothetical protein
MQHEKEGPCLAVHKHKTFFRALKAIKNTAISMVTKERELLQ